MKARQFLQTVAASGTPEALTQRGITSMTRSGTTVTVTASENHGFATGDYVKHTGATQAQYNVTRVITVTSATVYTFSIDYEATLPATPATGTPVAVGQLESIKAIVTPAKDLARTANTGTVFCGPTSTNDEQSDSLAAVTDQLVIEPPSGKYFNLADWFADVVTNADGVIVQFWPRI